MDDLRCGRRGACEVRVLSMPTLPKLGAAPRMEDGRLSSVSNVCRDTMDAKLLLEASPTQKMKLGTFCLLIGILIPLYGSGSFRKYVSVLEIVQCMLW